MSDDVGTIRMIYDSGDGALFIETHGDTVYLTAYGSRGDLESVIPITAEDLLRASVSMVQEAKHILGKDRCFEVLNDMKRQMMKEVQE